MASVIGQDQLSPSCTCMVCLDVLYDPVTLPCGHSLDQGCLQKVLDSRGQRACPTCRAPLPAEVPAISVQLREMVQERYPQQVGTCEMAPIAAFRGTGDGGVGW